MYRNHISIFNDKNNIEFEIRFSLTEKEELFHKIINHFKDKPNEISQTLNVISKMGYESHIETRHFTHGVQDKSKISYSRKRSMLRPADVNHPLLNYRVSVSEEKPLDAFSSVNPHMYRFKWRISYILQDWRIDMTLAKEITNRSQIKGCKSQFFKRSEISAAPIDYADKIELELERITPNSTPLDKPQVDSILNTIYYIIDAEYIKKVEYQTEIYNLSKYLVDTKDTNKFKNRLGIKQLTTQVRDLTKNSLHTVKSNITNYFITDKADGERTIIFSDKLGVRIINSNLIKFAQSTSTTYVIDCELVDGVLYAFDVLFFDGKDIRGKPLEERVKCLPNVASIFKSIPTKIEFKNQIKISDNVKESITKIIKYTKSRPYETDGYILTENTSYYKTAFKIKYLENISIDFLVMKAPETLIGVNPYTRKAGCTMYFLFSGVSKYIFENYAMNHIKLYDEIFAEWNFKSDYFPMQFSPSSSPFAYIYYKKESSKNAGELHGKICELAWKGEWTYLRTRTDRDIEVARGNYFGNDFVIAENIWQSYNNPLFIEDLYIENADYFQVHDNPMYKASRAFNSFAKTSIINAAIDHVKKTFKSTSLSGVDLGSGKGQDIHRYNLNHVLFIDIDKTALQELVSRKKTQKSKLKISVMQADLNQSYDITLDEAMKHVNKVNMVVCNMTIHYLVRNEEAIRNLIGLVKGLLCPGGVFAYTAFDGQKVFNLIKDKNWSVREGTVLKYSINKKYKAEKIYNGLMVDVLLPFTNGVHYEESLVNVNYINDEFRLNGFNKAKLVPFDSLFNKYDYINKLNDGDKQFVGLYIGCLIVKEKLKGGRR